MGVDVGDRTRFAEDAVQDRLVPTEICLVVVLDWPTRQRSCQQTAVAKEGLDGLQRPNSVVVTVEAVGAIERDPMSCGLDEEIEVDVEYPVHSQTEAVSDQAREDTLNRSLGDLAGGREQTAQLRL